MALVTVYGEGGYDPNLPNDNIIEQYEIPDPPAPEPQTDTQALAEALSELPPETLDALRAALGLT